MNSSIIGKSVPSTCTGSGLGVFSVISSDLFIFYRSYLQVYLLCKNAQEKCFFLPACADGCWRPVPSCMHSQDLPVLIKLSIWCLLVGLQFFTLEINNDTFINFALQLKHHICFFLAIPHIYFIGVVLPMLEQHSPQNLFFVCLIILLSFAFHQVLGIMCSLYLSKNSIFNC